MSEVKTAQVTCGHSSSDDDAALGHRSSDRGLDQDKPHPLYRQLTFKPLGGAVDRRHRDLNGGGDLRQGRSIADPSGESASMEGPRISIRSRIFADLRAPWLHAIHLPSLVAMGRGYMERRMTLRASRCADGMGEDLNRLANVEPRELPSNFTALVPLCQWIAGEVSAFCGSSKHLDLLFRDPVCMVRKGYALARAASRRQDPPASTVAAACALVGLGAGCMWSQGVCDICFRRAMAGLRRCSVHSQSKFNEDKPRLGQSARSACAQAARPASWKEIRVALESFHSVEGTVAGILWPTRDVDINHWRAAVYAALQQAPRVSALFPHSFGEMSFRSQLGCLRAAIDPNEWNVRCWPTKIAYAEVWLREEARVASGMRKGLSAENSARCRAVRAQIALGVSARQAAANVGITYSHLRYLLERERQLSAVS